MKLDVADLGWRETHELFAGIVTPRPIALISTVGQKGIFNVAPFSFYGAVSLKPVLVFVGISAKVRAQVKKDTIRNIEHSGDFVINVVDEAIAERMNQTSADYPSDVSEFDEAGLTPAESDLVKAPRVKESPASMECRLKQLQEFGEFPYSNYVVLAEVLKVHVRDDLWVDGEIEVTKLKAIGRLGKELYCRTTDVFEMKRPYVLGQ